MKHIELIELLYKYRVLIDESFKGDDVSDIPVKLIDEVAIFQRVAKKYELSDSYVQFANMMLKRVDANYRFGDYNEEIKLLIELKGDFLETGYKNLLTRIKDLVSTLYKKIEQRDILINARINDIINDNESDMELVIKDAKDVDNRIAELIDAHFENLKILGTQLRGLDDGLDEILVDIGLDMLPFTENIHMYNKRLSDFILRTEKRKRQNKKLQSISNKIIKEKDNELKALILSNTQMYHHTSKERKTGIIKHIPTSFELGKTSFLEAMKRVLLIQKKDRKADNSKPYKKAKVVQMKAIRIKILQEDVAKDKPEDIYKYVLHHSEIEKFKEDETDKVFAFKIYLTIIQDNRKNIVLENKYNESNIRIARWI